MADADDRAGAKAAIAQARAGGRHGHRHLARPGPPAVRHHHRARPATPSCSPTAATSTSSPTSWPPPSSRLPRAVPVRLPGRRRRLGGRGAAGHRHRPARHRRHRRRPRGPGRRLPGHDQLQPVPGAARREAAAVGAAGRGASTRSARSRPRCSTSRPRATASGPAGPRLPAGRVGARRVPRLPPADHGQARRRGRRDAGRAGQPGAGDGTVATQALIKAVWTDDTGQVDPHGPPRRPLHGPGRAGRRHPGGPGTRPRRATTRTATVKLGRAVQLAAASGHEDTMRLLQKVVDVDDAEQRHGAAAQGRREGGRDDPRHPLDPHGPARQDRGAARGRGGPG